MASAGTGALVGAPMDARAADQARACGLEPAMFRARSLTPAMIAEADLVLTATRGHRGRVVTMYPKALPYTFALLDFADLVGRNGWERSSPRIHRRHRAGIASGRWSERLPPVEGLSLRCRRARGHRRPVQTCRCVLRADGAAGSRTDAHGGCRAFGLTSAPSRSALGVNLGLGPVPVRRGPD